MIASAVMAPDTEPVPDTNATRKRRQSEVEEDESENKRQRLSTGKESLELLENHESGEQNATQTSAVKQQGSEDKGEARRKSSTGVDEKQRSKRLFGALLGNLNQPKNDTRAKKRQDAEARRKAEFRRQDHERSQDKNQPTELLADRRKREERTFEKEKMRTRHSNMLDRSNFLLTKTEPRLYYRPWDLKPEEEDRIDLQKRETRAKVDRELDAFFDSKLKSDDASALPTSTNDSETTKPTIPDQTKDVDQSLKSKAPEPQGQVKSDVETESKDQDVPNTDPRVVVDTSAEQETTAPDPPTNNDETKKQEEVEADHVVEGGAEDDVIY